MRPYSEFRAYAVHHPLLGKPDPDEGGYFVLKTKGVTLRCIASWSYGWDHVSVTVNGEDRCPTWEEMSHVKDVFFKPEEPAFQFHPPDSMHVNFHPYCLHLWRSQSEPLLLPPKEMLI